MSARLYPTRSTCRRAGHPLTHDNLAWQKLRGPYHNPAYLYPICLTCRRETRSRSQNRADAPEKKKAS